MLQFTCVSCGTAILIDESLRGTNVICSNCNLRQPVPATAVTVPTPVSVPVSESVERPPAQAQPMPPDYALLQILGFILIGLGILECVIAVLIGLFQNPIAFL